jgi:hypothetical protein
VRKVVPPSFGLFRLPRLLLAYELLHLLHHFSSLDLLLLLWVIRVRPTRVWKLSAPPPLSSPYRRIVRTSMYCDSTMASTSSICSRISCLADGVPSTCRRSEKKCCPDAQFNQSEPSHHRQPATRHPPARDRHLTLMQARVHESKPIPHIRIAHRSHRCSYSVCTAPSSQPGQVVQSAFQCASRPRPRREGEI